MKKTYTPEEKINYLYGLMKDEDQAVFEQHMMQDEELRQEIRSMALLQDRLSDVGMVHPPAVNPESIIRQSERNWRKTMFQTVRYAAIFLITLIVIGSLSNINIRYDDSGLQLSMSVWPEQTVITRETPPSDSIDPTTLALLQEFQEKQAELVADVIAKDRADQRRQMQELFTEYATMIENRRMIDMELIQYELDNIAQHTDTRQRRTDLVLSSLLESISLNN